MWSARRRLSTVVVQRFCKPKVGGSNPSAGTIPLRFASRRTYPQAYARIRSRICESAEKFRLDSQAIPAHIRSVVPIFGSKPWSPGNFGFRGFLVSGVLAEPRELRFRGFFVSWRCRISAPPIGRPNIFRKFSIRVEPGGATRVLLTWFKSSDANHGAPDTSVSGAYLYVVSDEPGSFGSRLIFAQTYSVVGSRSASLAERA